MGRKLRKLGFVSIILLALMVLSLQTALAQAYPTKPIKIVVPSRAGGGHDLTFRAVTSVAADYLGQPVIVQLKPGGGGAI